jgi:hypothetical protein
LRGCTDEFNFGKHGGEVKKVSMSNWNPVLLSIAFKKVEILRYLINDLRISLATSGTSPDSQVVDVRFSLQVAAAFHDLPTLVELWGGVQK